MAEAETPGTAVISSVARMLKPDNDITWAVRQDCLCDGRCYSNDRIVCCLQCGRTISEEHISCCFEQPSIQVGVFRLNAKLFLRSEAHSGVRNIFINHNRNIKRR